MASQGPLSPGTASETTQFGGDVTWQDPTNITAADGQVASALPRSRVTYLLTARNFGFSIPSNHTIEGVLVEYLARDLDATSRFNKVQLLNLVGANWEIIGSVDTTNTFLTSSFAYHARGGGTVLWGAPGGLSPAVVNSPFFGVGVAFDNPSESRDGGVEVDHVRMTVFHSSPNTAPTITVAPTVSYGSLTRLGPNNTPATVSFTATDADGDALTYEIRTAASGGGTLVDNGNASPGAPVNHSLAHNAPGLVEGTNNLFLRVSDGTDYSADAPFTVLVDRSPPTVGTIISTPSPVTGGG